VPYTAHEGQIIARARFPGKNHLYGKDIENLIGVLSIEGGLRAWRMTGPVEGQGCQLIVEYNDSSKAQRASQRFNGKTFGVSHYFPPRCPLDSI